MKPLRTAKEWLEMMIRNWGKFPVENIIPTENSPKEYQFMVNALLAMLDE